MSFDLVQGLIQPAGSAVHSEHLHPMRQTRIFIVEDDELQQEVLKSALDFHGYEVETSADGLDALWKIREGRYDVVLVDYQLPEIDGLAMARLIRDLMGTVACPALIALTGSPDTLADKERVPGSAFDEIIPKCSGLDRLIFAIQRQLKARPSAAAQREAEFALLANDWTEYDASFGSDGGQVDQSAAPRILVVEDDELQQSVLKSALESCGYAVEGAFDGLQAVRMIREGAFDLALVDYKLPEMDGLATGRLILDLLGEGVRPRMIALTSAPTHLIARMADTGSAFDEIVAKSAGLPALLSTVERHLRSSPRSATRRAAAVAFPFAA